MKYAFVFLLVQALELVSSLTLERDLILNSNYKFATSLYKNLVQIRNDGENFITSPFSAQVILSLAHSGAKNLTAEELRLGLGFSRENNQQAIDGTFASVLPSLDHNLHYKILSANKIYVSNNYTLNDEFVATANATYEADFEQIDFVPQSEAAKSINSWVENKTDNKIHNLLDPEWLNNNTRAVLINALLFKANWTSPFQTFLTAKRSFHQSDGSIFEIDMMHDFDGAFNYMESPELGAKFVELFMGANNYGNVSMVIALPDQPDGLAKLEQQIDQVLTLTNFSSEVVNLALPKFKIETKVDLKQILISLGVRKAFSPNGADFSGIAGNAGELFIDQVVQKCFVKVDEDGVEATAATVVVKVFNRLGIPPKEFIADHPFLFYIKIQEIVIFIGRVTKPVF